MTTVFSCVSESTISRKGHQNSRRSTCKPREIPLDTTELVLKTTFFIYTISRRYRLNSHILKAECETMTPWGQEKYIRLQALPENNGLMFLGGRAALAKVRTCQEVCLQRVLFGQR